MYITTNKDELRGTLRKENKLTVWISLPDGHIIKRHKIKNKVIYNG